LSQQQPIFNGPRVVLVTLLVLVVVHVVRSLLSDQQDEWVILAGAFIPARFAGRLLPGGELAKVTSFISHTLLHGDLVHLGLNCGWLLAFGTIVARRITAWSFILLLAVTGTAGAALFLACNWGLAQPMVGASGAISGLMGAAVRFIFVPGGYEQARGGRAHAASMSLAQLLRDSRARLMIGSWVAINLVFGLVLGQLFSEGGIAWEAHLGGFMAGLLLFPWFDRTIGTTARPTVAD
jgi:membrane associated rhomboid family serine protease